jgi:hypothetical protein
MCPDLKHGVGSLPIIVDIARAERHSAGAFLIVDETFGS